MAVQTVSREYYKNRRSLSERFAEMDEKIKVPSFRQSTGKANEVNYWVFDYPPEQELEVRSHIEWLKKRNSKGFDDYELIIPVILFYPGTYTEQELVVFNEFVEDSYYRAFRIAR